MPRHERSDDSEGAPQDAPPPITVRIDEDSGLIALEGIEERLLPTFAPLNWLHAFVHRHGLAQTTVIATIFAIILSLGLSSLIFGLRGHVISPTGLIASIVVPAIGAPLTFISVLRLFLNIDQAQDHLREEIVERAKAELSLRVSEARYRAIFESSNDIILLHDLKGSIIIANSKAYETLGFDKESLLGSSLFDLGDDEEFTSRLEAIIDSGAGNFDGVVKTASGDKIIAAINCTALDPEGQLVQTVIRDVTEQRETDKALRLAKEASEEANRLKSRFVFNVSHDIRTPLNGIVGFAEAILAERTITRAHRHAWTILDESETLVLLINDLLDLAKIEAEKMDLDPIPLDLEHLAASVIAPLEHQAQAKKLELSWSIKPETPRYVRADVMRLRQILLNLLANAVKFTEQGRVELTIAPMESDDDEPHLLFAVSDTGIGIEEDKQKAIFQSFAQADATTTRRYGGTGLGTTIARELVSLMKGDIGVFSVPEQGSTFWFTLPVDECSPASISGEVPRLRDWDRSSEKAGRILLAEDYPTNQEIARMQLEGGGHAVTVVENGEQALKAVERKPFDLILMDLQMPIMDGHQATKLIRLHSERDARTPIIAMTASAETSTRDACLKAGMDDVIIKPLRRVELLKLVEKWLLKGASTRNRSPRLESDAPDSESPTFSSASSSAKSEAPETPLDLEKALEQFAHNRPLLEKTLLRFLEQTEQDLPSMVKLRREEDWEALRKEAHKLKGAAAYLAARPLARAATDLEDNARNHQPDLVATSLDNLDEQLSRLKVHTEKNVCSEN